MKNQSKGFYLAQWRTHCAAQEHKGSGCVPAFSSPLPASGLTSSRSSAKFGGVVLLVVFPEKEKIKEKYINKSISQKQEPI